MSVRNWLRFWALGLVWGTSFLWIKVAITEVSPWILVSFRTFFGALGLAFLIFPRRNLAFLWRQVRPYLGVYVFIGFVNVALPFGLISWAEQYIDSGMAAILNATVPLFTIIIAPLVLPDDRFSMPKLAGLVVGFIGVVILLSPDLKQGITAGLIGQAALLLATFSYAVGAVATRRYARDLPAELQAFLQLTMSTIMMWIFTLVVDRPLRMPALPITWLALLWLGILGSCVAYLLYFSLIHSIGPTRASMVTYVLPLVGVMLGAFFLGEQLYWQSLAGGALILSGIAVVNARSLARLAAEKA